MSFTETATPRYLQIADLLRKRIARGVWKPGERVPTLQALMDEFGVARVTVRQAIERLAREGLVSPQRGRGTFVMATPQRRWQREWQTVHASVDALADAFRATKPRLVTIDESVDAAPLRPGEGLQAERYVYMRRVHAEGDEPYCVIDIHLDAAIFMADRARYRREAVVPLLAALGDDGIAHASQILTIANADLEVAELLNVQVGDAVAEVRRVFRDRHGRVIYLGEVTYRGDLFRLVMDLEPPAPVQPATSPRRPPPRPRRRRLS